MADPLSDEFSLRLLRHLVSGDGLKVNVNALSRQLGIHRKTAGEKVERLFGEGVLAPPRYPFLRLYEEYPVLVLAWADIPRVPQAIDFFMEDSNIFAAFSCMEGPHNTLLLEYFRDMESYHGWREAIVRDHRLPARENRAPAEVRLVSNRLIFKNDPRCFLSDMRREFGREGRLCLEGTVLDANAFRVFETLAGGECIRLRETYLSEELAASRKSVARRASALVSAGVLGSPACFFPNLLVPPGYNMILSLMEVKERREEIKRHFMRDTHIPRAMEISSGRYNMIVFCAFRTIEEFFDWGEELLSRFQGCIGAIDNTFLSHNMIHKISGHKVSLGLIERKLRGLE